MWQNIIWVSPRRNQDKHIHTVALITSVRNKLEELLDGPINQLTIREKHRRFW